MADLAIELQRIYDSEINVRIGWFWDAGINIRLGAEMNGIEAEETARSADESFPLPESLLTLQPKKLVEPALA